jgi:hypothetical protein
VCQDSRPDRRAASDGFDQLTSWTNFGRKSVSLAAPGVDILTTEKGGGYWNVSDL